MLIFWQDFARLTSALFNSWPYTKLKLRPGEGMWEENNQRVLDFLSLIPFPESGATPQEALGWAGLYRDRNGGREFIVDYQKGALTINLMQKARSRLLRISGNTFLVEGWHFEVNFSPDGSFLTIGGRDVDYLKLVGIRAEKAA